MAVDTLTSAELFCGAGGLSEGFVKAGFNVLAANDFDDRALATLQAAHPKIKVIPGPIEDISPLDLVHDSGLKKGELDVLSGGPPCQAFSVYNHQRGMHDERSGLFRQYLRIVEGLLPKFVVMENVTGILSAGEGRAVKEIQDRLKDLGYNVERRILKAEEFGVPQERRRVFFVGNRCGAQFVWPEPTHGINKDGSKKLKPVVTVWDAISDLPPRKIQAGEEEQDYTNQPKSDYQKLMRVGSAKLYNHVAPFLSDINLERLKFIEQGGSWRDIPVQLLPAGMKRARRCDHTKRYGRLHPKGLASTILTKCDLHWGAYIHPTQNRTLTVREAARFQSFPDRFRFLGSRVDQFRQVGNAVPPLLAEAVARAVARSLRKAPATAATKELSHAG